MIGSLCRRKTYLWRGGTRWGEIETVFRAGNLEFNLLVVLVVTIIGPRGMGVKVGPRKRSQS